MFEGEEARLLERERILAALGSLLEFAEGWKEDDLCGRFRVIFGSLFPETPEFRLACVLVEASEPLSLSEIASGCGVNRELVVPGGKIRRAIERLERAGLLVDAGKEGLPRYRLDQSNPAARLLGRVCSRRWEPRETMRRDDGLRR